MPRQLLHLPPAKRERVREMLAADVAPTEIAATLKLTWETWERLAASDRMLKAVLDEHAARDRERLFKVLRDSETVQGAIFLLGTLHGVRPEPAAPGKKKGREPAGAVGVVVPKARTVAEFTASAAGAKEPA